MIFFTGASGGIGRFFKSELSSLGLKSFELRSRLESSPRAELDAYLKSHSDEKHTYVSLVHLAAKVSVPWCERFPLQAQQTNVADTESFTRIFIQWARSHCLEARILYVSTGHLYAEHAMSERIGENAALHPRSVYAESKRQAEDKLRELSLLESVELKVARVFGVLSPMQESHFILPALIHKVKSGDVSALPGLRNFRDYLDARDVALSLGRLLGLNWTSSAFSSQVVNICSGQPLQIREIYCEVGRQLLGATPPIEEAPPLPGDLPWIVGDPTLFHQMTGQSCSSRDYKQSIADALLEA